MCLGNKKLVVLGIPWDVDSEGLKVHMSQFGELADVIVMKDRITGRSRGFGYVSFSSAEDAQKAIEASHILNGRTLEVKIATPREEMAPITKKNTRIFVARIPSSVTDESFHSYFLKYGPIVDAYMPKDPLTKQQRGIGFVTYENPESVDQLMSESHELSGSTIAVDRATPKEGSRGYRALSHYPRAQRCYPETMGYGYVDNHSRILLTLPQGNMQLPSSEQTASNTSTGGPMLVAGDASLTGQTNGQPAVAAPPRVEKKLFIGRVPVEATADDLQAYFSQFGWVLDVYLPMDAQKISHRGFGFVTFADEASAARVTRRRHYLHGREIAVDSAVPGDRVPGSAQLPANAVSSVGVESNLPLEVANTAAANDGSQPVSMGSAKWGKKLFVGRVPIEATSNDLLLHFSQFGPILDVYLPKDDKKVSHRGFGFITFADEISAEYASQKMHRILGQKIVLDRAAPPEGDGSNHSLSSFVTNETPLDGNVPLPGLQGLTSQQAYALQLAQYNSVMQAQSSRDAPVNRVPRVAARYRPY